MEGRNVVRSSARDQAVVHDDFFIDPIRARVPDISLDRGPGSDGSAADNACVDQDLGAWQIAATGFALAKEMAHELERLFGLPPNDTLAISKPLGLSIRLGKMHSAVPMWRNGRRNGLKIRFH